VSVQDTASPFGYKRGEGIDAGKGETGWVVAKERQKYDAVFNTLEKSDGKLSGAGTKLCIIYYITRAVNVIHYKIHLKTIKKICIGSLQLFIGGGYIKNKLRIYLHIIQVV